MAKRNLKIPRAKAHPDQAGFIRRGLALGVDIIIITIISFVIYVGASESLSGITGEPGIVSQIVDAFSNDKSVSVVLGSEEQSEGAIKSTYLEVLEERLDEEEYALARDMNAEEIADEFHEKLREARDEYTIIETGEGLDLIREFIVGYIYFVLFFRFGGRTLGKRIFGLKAIDLKGKQHLGWYQSFERTHGYAASALFLSLGYWQVLWDAEGLSMHDKIAGTTVVRVRKGKKNKEGS